MRASGTVVAALMALGFGAWPAAAQQSSTYVISTGRDSGTCPVTAPCRTFRYALTQTTPGGEIVALDVSGYGPVTIDRAVTITSGGSGRAYIGDAVVGGSAIAINAGSGDAVHLRGLQLVAGGYGIKVNSAGSVEVSDVSVTGMTIAGLYVGASTSVVVSRSTFTSNNVGVDAESGSLVMRNVNINTGSSGVLTAATTYLVKCTVETQSIGVRVLSGSTFLKGSLLTQSGTGLQVDAGTVRLDATTTSGNTTGVSNSGGTTISYGDNNITDSTVGTITQMQRD